MNRKRWHDLMTRLGLEEAQQTFESLEAAYSENHRYYHTEVHVDACLELLDSVKASVAGFDDAEIAIWFHDAIYRVGSATNEADSADWAEEFMTESKLDASRIERVREIILATAHGDEPKSDEARLVVDIDLAILGAGEDVYDEYSSGIRSEHRTVPEEVFVRERGRVLKPFLDRPRIYLTQHFHDMFEEQARRNLRREIEAGGTQ